MEWMRMGQILMMLVCLPAFLSAFFLTHRTVKPDEHPHTPNYIRLRKNDGLACSSNALAANECGAEPSLECLKEVCTRCAAPALDPYAYCMRVTVCVCAMSRDPSCHRVVDECY
ncbi:unnamed protein product, partial [Mesorhabditis belari]|uniref:Uncharacterized protein n=1 Tax=Mesorhabditis belari TaxID=2138241 RepID=A0AAF3EB72_9BILA